MRGIQTWFTYELEIDEEHCMRLQSEIVDRDVLSVSGHNTTVPKVDDFILASHIADCNPLDSVTKNSATITLTSGAILHRASSASSASAMTPRSVLLRCGQYIPSSWYKILSLGQLPIALTDDFPSLVEMLYICGP